MRIYDIGAHVIDDVPLSYDIAGDRRIQKGGIE